MSITPYGESRYPSLNKYLKIVRVTLTLYDCKIFFVLCVYFTEFKLLNCRRESDMVAHWRMSLQGCKSRVVDGNLCTTIQQERAS
jgi:hypothetical protein